MEEKIVQLTDQNFKSEVLEANNPVLVEFWAPWCGPCRIMAPVLEELASEYEGKIKVAKLNVDDNQDTAATYQILSIPTLIVFEKSEPQKKIVGAIPKKKLVDELSSWL